MPDPAPLPTAATMLDEADRDWSKPRGHALNWLLPGEMQEVREDTDYGGPNGPVWSNGEGPTAAC